jgi:predicted Zn-dependent protease
MAKRFEASLFHPDFGNEVVRGELFIDRQTLRFVADGISEEIPTEDVEVTLEEKGERVYFSDPSRPELTIFTTDQSILKHPSLRQCEAIWSQVAGILNRREVSRRLRLTLYFVAGCVLVTVIGSWVLGAMVRSIATRVPPEWEEKFGQQEMAEFAKEVHFADDSNLVARLTAIAQPLMEVLPPDKRNLKFYVVDEFYPNAFALPGGHVVVTAGLLEMVDSREQLLGVLAHEMAHVTKKHHFRIIASSAGPFVIFEVFLHSDSGMVKLFTKGSGFIVTQGFSKEYETEADEGGWDYLVAAKIDPRGMIEVFRKFRTYEIEKGAIHIPEAFESHPALDKRIALLERKSKNLPPMTFLHLEPLDLKSRKTH